jgi:hypothetical protein
MTMFYGTTAVVKSGSASTGKIRIAGRWVTCALGLGLLVLTGYLTIGHLSTPAATMSVPHSAAQLAPTQVTTAPGNETGSVTPSNVVHEESTGSSMTRVLNAVLGTLLAAAWVMVRRLV